MSTIKLWGQVDEQHKLSADVPETIAPGLVEILVHLPADEEDDVGAAWTAGIAREWAAELSDAREDIYTLEDGEPVARDARRDLPG